MRPIERGHQPNDDNENPITFDKYQDAGLYLKERLGKYCSYCEMHLPVGLHVEHIQPKSRHPVRELDWHNLLLACVHCNSAKGDTEIRLKDYYWPDCNNTFLAFKYVSDGSIIPHPTLTAQQKRLAQKTLALFNLSQNTCPENDPRLLQRREVWEIAKEALTDLQNGAKIRTIIRLAQANGFWSVWMTVFQDDPDILKQLIKAFPGTCLPCFDSSGRPIPRPRDQYH
jgi:uncharacterized protein (TIGR02646 family)